MSFYIEIFKSKFLNAYQMMNARNVCRCGVSAQVITDQKSADRVVVLVVPFWGVVVLIN